MSPWLSLHIRIDDDHPRSATERVPGNLRRRPDEIRRPDGDQDVARAGHLAGLLERARGELFLEHYDVRTQQPSAGFADRLGNP